MTEGPERRRIEAKPARDTSGRSGCLMIGGLLGIAVGVVVALWVIPPLLESAFGVTSLDVGETYDGEGRVISVASVTREQADAGDIITITLNALTRRSWELLPEDLTLTMSGGDGRIGALEPDEAIPETSLEFDAGEERLLLVRFRVDADDGEPESMRVGDPHVEFALPPVTP